MEDKSILSVAENEHMKNRMVMKTLRPDDDCEEWLAHFHHDLYIEWCKYVDEN
jgi:hypothetical protein